MGMCVLLIILIAATSRTATGDTPEEAIQRIESIGGQIKRDERLPGRPVTEISLGRYFDEHARKVFDENARHLRLFTKLRTLKLAGA